jgi:hypothetical protein
VPLLRRRTISNLAHVATTSSSSAAGGFHTGCYPFSTPKRERRRRRRRGSSEERREEKRRGITCKNHPPAASYRHFSNFQERTGRISRSKRESSLLNRIMFAFDERAKRADCSLQRGSDSFLLKHVKVDSGRSGALEEEIEEEQRNPIFLSLSFSLSLSLSLSLSAL